MFSALSNAPLTSEHSMEIPFDSLYRNPHCASLLYKQQQKEFMGSELNQALMSQKSTISLNDGLNELPEFSLGDSITEASTSTVLEAEELKLDEVASYSSSTLQSPLETQIGCNQFHSLPNLHQYNHENSEPPTEESLVFDNDSFPGNHGVEDPTSFSIKNYAFERAPVQDFQHVSQIKQDLPQIRHQSISITQVSSPLQQLATQPLTTELSLEPGPAPQQPLLLQQQHTQYRPYPDVTTLVNSNSNIIGPMVEMTFVDYKVCNICNKRITRDMSRHWRTHQLQKRFTCRFSKEYCSHKTGQFNRRYDFKKHLLNRHFIHDDPSIVKMHNLREKLHHWGTCLCGQRFVAQQWIDDHVITEIKANRCPLMIDDRSDSANHHNTIV